MQVLYCLSPLFPVHLHHFQLQLMLRPFSFCPLSTFCFQDNVSSSHIVDNTTTLAYLKSWFLFLTFIYVILSFVEKSFLTSMCSQMVHILEYPTQIYFLLGSGRKGVWIAKSGIKWLLYPLPSGHMVFSYRGMLEQEDCVRHFFHSLYFLLSDFPGLESMWSAQTRGLHRQRSRPRSSAFPSCHPSPLWDTWSVQGLLYQRFYYLLKSKNLVLNSCTPHNSLHVTDFTSSFVL